MRRGASAAVLLFLAMVAIPPALGYSPPRDLRLTVTVQGDSAAGHLLVTAANPGARDLESVVLEGAVPSGIALVPEQGSVVGGVWRLTLARLPAGASVTVSLRYASLPSRGGAAPFEVSAKVLGAPAAEASAEIPAPPTPAWILAAVAGAIGALAGAAALAWRRARAAQVFLLHRSGMLIAARSASRRDPDILAGMLVVLQQAARRGLADPTAVLREIRFAGGTLLLVPGRSAILAAVALGRPSRLLRWRLRRALGRFEAGHARELAGWNGELASLPGAERLVARL